MDRSLRLAEFHKKKTVKKIEVSSTPHRKDEAVSRPKIEELKISGNQKN